MSLKNAPCFKELADSLKAHTKAGRVLIELVSGGNWGDALIHAGQKKFLAEYNIRHIRMPIKQMWHRNTRKILKSRSLRPVALFSGGGALMPWWKRYDQLLLASDGFNRTIVLPSSIGMPLELKSRFTDVWLRETTVSPQFVPDYRFCHDMAFFLAPSPREITKGPGHFFRTDLETVSEDLPADNNDISAKGRHNSDPEVFLDEIGKHEVIYTDRLHVGISGALLGRETHIFASRGDKTRAIFNASIAPNYPNVSFHEESPKEFGIEFQ
ncbi:MAG: polysaccharide pyruvyl transferase family protein [Tateyamaria sp.]|uniref:polysaccharide pyruvyl transferase family protein n=1 Tax=Tateyamaria sp. TaxID=1929288 RepID=UPI0032A08323